MSKPELPPLPPPFKYPEGNIVAVCACGSWPGGECLRCPIIQPFTEGQMHEYGLACYRKGLEDAAKVCDRVSAFLWASVHRTAPAASHECASAIRALVGDEK